MDIFRADNADEIEEGRTLAMSSHVPSETYSKFLQEGPLNEYVHADWSPEKKIKERKLLKETAGSPQKSPSRQQSTASSRVPSRHTSAKPTPRSRVPSADVSSVFGASSSIAELKLGPNSGEMVEQGDGGGNPPADIVITEGDESVASDDNWAFSDGQSVSDALSFATEEGELFSIG